MINCKHLSIITLLFITNITFSMEPNNAQELATKEGMTKISKWDDVTPFAGRFVAYVKTPNNEALCSESEKDYEYRLSNPLFIYALVHWRPANWSFEKEKAYELFRLLKKEKTSANACYPFTNSKVKKAHVYMRDTTTQELLHIKEVITNNQAYFHGFHKDDSYDSRNEAESLLLGYIISQLQENTLFAYKSPWCNSKVKPHADLHIMTDK